VCRKVAGETLLVPIRGTVAEIDRLFSLDGVAIDIWNALGKPCAVTSLVDLLVGEYSVGREKAESDVSGFLRDLLARGLVVEEETSEQP